MKKFVALFLALLMIGALAACGNGAGSKYAGTYTCEKYKCVGDSEGAWTNDEEPQTLELKADGTGTSTRDGMEYKMTWKVDGETFTMQETFAGITLDYTGTIAADGTIHLYNGDPTNDLTYEYYFAKK